jgi:uncharacterized RDD family membrane protein YckC
MTQDPYAAPQASLDPPAPPASPVLYARIGVRFRAWLIDYVILLASFLLVAVVGSQLESLPGAGAVLFATWIAFMFLYEPLLVWRTGGTIGHHLKNLHVVSERTGSHPGLVAALVRHLIKAFLGWLSYLLLLDSTKQQAIHDVAVGVTVRLKDPTLARRRDYVRAAR